jgi:hypothetical protein
MFNCTRLYNPSGMRTAILDHSDSCRARNRGKSLGDGYECKCSYERKAAEMRLDAAQLLNTKDWRGSECVTHEDGSITITHPKAKATIKLYAKQAPEEKPIKITANICSPDAIAMVERVKAKEPDVVSVSAAEIIANETIDDRPVIAPAVVIQMREEIRFMELPGGRYMPYRVKVAA